MLFCVPCVERVRFAGGFQLEQRQLAAVDFDGIPWWARKNASRTVKPLDLVHEHDVAVVGVNAFFHGCYGPLGSLLCR